MSSSISAGSTNQITLEHTGVWLSKGWRDFQRAPGLSLLYGSIFPAVGIGLTILLHVLEMDSLIFLLACGFMLIGPLAATCLYEIARRLEAREPLSAALVFESIARRATAIGDLGWLLMMIFLCWLMIGLGMFALFFSAAPPTMPDFIVNMLFNPHALPFILVSTVVGGLLAGLAFTISMFAMPMLVDQDVTAPHAILFSIRAVWLNRLNMIGWAATVALLTFLGMALGFIGLVVIFPIVAYASWHAYRDVAG